MTLPHLDPSPHTLVTTAGRETLLTMWWHQQPPEEASDRIQHVNPEQRAALLTKWLRWCISEQGLDPHTRLPPYHTLASLFALSQQQVASAIALLREEGVLPTRAARIDKGHPQWTARDEYLWVFIGCMHAIRFDQAQRLLARESEQDTPDDMLSVSRTSEIIKRWTAAKFAVFRPVFHAQPGWIHLTRRGLRQVGLEFRAETPSVGTLEHLFWITEVRLSLEEEHPHMHWISEREIQAEQDLRTRGQSVIHIPDGILLPDAQHTPHTSIDIEVQISRPGKQKVLQVMADLIYTQSTNPLRYYVSRKARRVVLAALHDLQQAPWSQASPRPHVQVFDLEEDMRLLEDYVP